MINDLGIIVAAAGSGNRYGHNKLLVQLNGLPLFIHCLKNFTACCPDNQIILVTSLKDQEYFRAALKIHMPDHQIGLVAGGDYRARSIANGLKKLPENVNYTAIHDAARPFASAELLKCCLDTARVNGSAIPAKPVTDTIKRVDSNNLITTTVCRNNLWRVETPQVFELKSLKQAYSSAENIHGELIDFTDDAAVMEAAGFPVKIVNNPKNNLKITYPEDIVIAENFLKQQQMIQAAD